MVGPLREGGGECQANKEKIFFFYFFFLLFENKILKTAYINTGNVGKVCKVVVFYQGFAIFGKKNGSFSPKIVGKKNQKHLPYCFPPGFQKLCEKRRDKAKRFVKFGIQPITQYVLNTG